MKSTFLALFVFYAFLSFGQTTTTTSTKSTPFVQFGVKAGVNYADVKTDLYPGHDNRLDFHAGIIGHIHMSPHVAIQPEIVYSRQGFEQMISSSLDLDMELDYINVPVLFQYMNRGFRIETGPQVGFLVNAKNNLSNGDEEELKDLLKPIDFSWDFGLSYLSAIGLGIS
ncbi:MAG: porin family protein, partial [Flavisolibacter sp.]